MPRDPPASRAAGAGTKLRPALSAGRHETLGAGLVNDYVNAVITSRARSLFFLDYFATGTRGPAPAAAVVLVRTDPPGPAVRLR